MFAAQSGTKRYRADFFHGIGVGAVLGDCTLGQNGEARGDFSTHHFSAVGRASEVTAIQGASLRLSIPDRTVLTAEAASMASQPTRHRVHSAA